MRLALALVSAAAMLAGCLHQDPAPPDSLLIGNLNQARPSVGQITEDSIVILGDSIAQMGNWSSLLAPAARPVINCGRGGDRILDVALRVPEVADRQPAVIVLICGTNDVGSGLIYEPQEWIPVAADCYAAILAQISERSPHTRVICVPVIRTTDRTRSQIAWSLDQWILLPLAQAAGAQWCEAAWYAVDPDQGHLDSTGIHLTPAGYDALAGALLPMLVPSGGG